MLEAVLGDDGTSSGSTSGLLYWLGKVWEGVQLCSFTAYFLLVFMLSFGVSHIGAPRFPLLRSTWKYSGTLYHTGDWMGSAECRAMPIPFSSPVLGPVWRSSSQLGLQNLRLVFRLYAVYPLGWVGQAPPSPNPLPGLFACPWLPFHSHKSDGDAGSLDWKISRVQDQSNSIAGRGRGLPCPWLIPV